MRRKVISGLVKTAVENRVLLTLLERLDISRPDMTPEELNTLRVLADLIEIFEKQEYPFTWEKKK